MRTRHEIEAVIQKVHATTQEDSQRGEIAKSISHSLCWVLGEADLSPDLFLDLIRLDDLDSNRPNGGVNLRRGGPNGPIVHTIRKKNGRLYLDGKETPMEEVKSCIGDEAQYLWAEYADNDEN